MLGWSAYALMFGLAWYYTAHYVREEVRHTPPPDWISTIDGR